MNSFSHQAVSVVPDIASNTQGLIESIGDDIYQQGYSIRPLAFPDDLSAGLYQQVKSMSWQQFHDAAIGREQLKDINTFVRTDKTCWIDGSSEAGIKWLHFAEDLRVHLNRTLQLGLFSFESHYAIYQPGDFYKRHLDAFKGKRNRIISTVLYLNPGWQSDHGGELLLYLSKRDKQGIRVQPLMGTLVCFMSEEFPHEVLPASHCRYSIAGWFRINGGIRETVKLST
ncbi:MAG: 2OG-Fe(II) oxygenase [Aestuariibacter sp.]